MLGHASRRTKKPMPLDRLSPEDERILKLESATIAGHTCKVAIVEPQPGSARPSLADLRERIVGRLRFAPRCRCRLALTPLGLAPPAWVEDEAFDVVNHVRRLPTAAPVSRDRFREIVADVMAQRLDRVRPLWQIDVVDPLVDGSIGLVWRLHHCMVDGVTALKLGSALLWDGEAPGDPEPPGRGGDGYGALELLTLGLGYRVRRAAAACAATGRSLASLRLDQVARVPAAVGRELAPTARPSPLDRRAGPTRAVAFASGELADFKRIGHGAETAATVNDVVLAVVAGAVRAWLERRDAPGAGIRVKVPVSLHHHEERPGDLGNRDSYFFVDLPVDEPDPVRRLLAITRETSDRKSRHDAELLYRLPAHRAVSRWALSPRVFTFNVSNVPGPAGPLSLLGAPVRELYSIAEIAERHALRISVISASGVMFFAFCADAEAVPDVDVLAEGVTTSLEELLERVG